MHIPCALNARSEWSRRTRLSDSDVTLGASKSFAAGAGPADQISVFIDGASYKIDIINGGVAGHRGASSPTCRFSAYGFLDDFNPPSG